MLLSPQTHATAVPAHTQPYKGHQLNAHGAEKVQKRLPQAEAAPVLLSSNYATMQRARSQPCGPSPPEERTIKV